LSFQESKKAVESYLFKRVQGRINNLIPFLVSPFFIGISSKEFSDFDPL